MKYCIYNGIFIEAEKNVIGIHSRGLMYGDGCFETLRLYDGHTYYLGRHLQRLEKGMAYLEMDKPQQDVTKPSECKKFLARLLVKNNTATENVWARIQMWREGKRGFKLSGNETTHWSLQTGVLKPNTYDCACTLITAQTRRIPSAALDSRYKLTNSINYIKAGQEADQAGADDALMLTVKGFISETTKANIFWINGDTIYTPSEACDLLPGITRAVLFGLIEKHNCTLKTGCFELEEIYKAEAVFICNSIREIQPVKRLDSYTFEPRHPLLEHLKKKFEQEKSDHLKPLIK